MAYPASPTPAPAPAPPPGSAASTRSVRVWDVVLTIVFLVLLALLALLTSYFGLFLGMVSDPCGGSVNCNGAAISAGVLTALVSPIVILLVAVVVSIVLLVRRRLAFWIPLAAAPLVLGSWFVGGAIAVSGVPQ